MAARCPGGSSKPGNASEIKWRDFFTDPRLKSYIELALVNNRDLRVAALNVEHARAEYRIQRSALFPTVDGTGSFTRSRTPAYTYPAANANSSLKAVFSFRNSWRRISEGARSRPNRSSLLNFSRLW